MTAWAEAGVEVVLDGDTGWRSATREYNDLDGATCVEISLSTDQERTPKKVEVLLAPLLSGVIEIYLVLFL